MGPEDDKDVIDKDDTIIGSGADDDDGAGDDGQGAGQGDKSGAGDKGAGDKGAGGKARVADRSDSVADDTDDDADDGGRAKPAGDWPSDWREKLAGGDEKVLKRLQRFASPMNVLKSWRAAEQKISSGEYTRRLPSDATEDQIMAWRQEMGLPEKPEDFKATEPTGHKWTEADKEPLNALFTMAHARNMSQEQVDGMLEYYAQVKAAADEQRAEADRAFKRDAEDALRSEYGAEYRPHMTLYARVLRDPEVFPGDSGAILASARTADGLRLINHPDVARALINLGLDRYGKGGMKTGAEVKASASRKAEIEKIMATDYDRYIREKLDEELLSISRAEEAGKPRRGQAA